MSFNIIDGKTALPGINKLHFYGYVWMAGHLYLPK